MRRRADPGLSAARGGAEHHDGLAKTDATGTDDAGRHATMATSSAAESLRMSS